MLLSLTNAGVHGLNVGNFKELLSERERIKENSFLNKLTKPRGKKTERSDFLAYLVPCYSPVDLNRINLASDLHILHQHEFHVTANSYLSNATLARKITPITEI